MRRAVEDEVEGDAQGERRAGTEADAVVQQRAVVRLRLEQRDVAETVEPRQAQVGQGDADGAELGVVQRECHERGWQA